MKAFTCLMIGVKMKRSEVLDIMEKFYDEHIEKIGYGWSERDFMDNLLADLEIIGLQPPKIIVETENYSLGKIHTVANEWESEDEEK